MITTPSKFIPQAAAEQSQYRLSTRRPRLNLQPMQVTKQQIQQFAAKLTSDEWNTLLTHRRTAGVAFKLEILDAEGRASRR